RSDVGRLYRYLIGFLKEQKPLPEKEEVIQALFPDAVYRVVELDLLMSYLFRLVSQYIIQKERDLSDWENELHLAIGLRKRGLEQDFSRTVKRLQTQLDQQDLRDAQFYHAHYALEWEQYLQFTSQSPTKLANLGELTKNMDRAYLARKLRHACLSIPHRTVYQTDHQIDLEEEVLQIVAASDWLSVPAIAIYYYCYYMQTDPEKEIYFTQFKAILFDHGQRFSLNETRDLYLLAINYCVRQANEGQSQYLEQLYELYREGLKKAVLLENGILSRFTYHNAVGVGLRTGHYVWTEQFIQEYKPALEKKYRNSSYSFNQARLEYDRKNYQAALPLLQQSNYRDLLLNLAAKTLLLKIYYELEEYDLLDSHLEAMLKYLRRKKVMGYHKTNYLNIIRFAKKLINVNAFNKREWQKLAQGITNEEVLTERLWLMNQLEKLKT
ncbi:MAG: hypothetical protein AAGD05_16400, partial [Bacteroidota bacterium]